ncbi:aspartate dehydrogenase [Candidatus Poriferisocius sp.]|uniref:aspartate dehydrogenase n=1 Tax=Candidatus Poriferisocius sp. TaxID=3101276 RepID=UPI003B024146
MLRVGLIGCGAIGSVVARELSGGAVDGAELAAVFDLVVDHPLGVQDRDSLLSRSDVVVEAAGHGALREHGVAVREAGTDLLVVSIGALADEELESTLRDAQGGRLLLCTGAIGGFDILRAAMLFGPLEEVAINSTKPAAALRRPWMDEALLDALAYGSEPVTVFDGRAREACVRFPESANVTATLSLATVGFDGVRVRLVGDPEAIGVRHVVCASGAAGAYELSFENAASPDNPRTSAVTAYSVLRALTDIQRPPVSVL